MEFELKQLQDVSLEQNASPHPKRFRPYHFWFISSILILVSSICTSIYSIRYIQDVIQKETAAENASWNKCVCEFTLITNAPSQNVDTTSNDFQMPVVTSYISCDGIDRYLTTTAISIKPSAPRWTTNVNQTCYIRDGYYPIFSLRKLAIEDIGEHGMKTLMSFSIIGLVVGGLMFLPSLCTMLCGQ